MPMRFLVAALVLVSTVQAQGIAVPAREASAPVNYDTLLKAINFALTGSDAGDYAFADRSEFSSEHRIVHPDASIRWIYARGRVVLDRGDILLPQKSYIQAPIEMKVESGYVTSIKGDLDADLLNDYMESFNDNEAYAISHVGWGLQDRARWSVMGLYGREGSIAMDARAFAGNFLFSLGPNTEAGGLRNTPCHIDIPMRNCTVELDGIAVLRAGRVVNG